MNIRRLSASDAAAFRALRLAALLDTPEAFATSHIEEKDLPLAAFEARLAERRGQAVFGAFDKDTLVGIAGLKREALLQTAHKGHIWGMYVAAAARGHGVARELMLAALAHARGAGHREGDAQRRCHERGGDRPVRIAGVQRVRARAGRDASCRRVARRIADAPALRARPLGSWAPRALPGGTIPSLPARVD